MTFLSEISLYTNLFQIRVWSQPDKIGQTSYAIQMIRRCLQFFTEYFNIEDTLTKTGTAIDLGQPT